LPALWVLAAVLAAALAAGPGPALAAEPFVVRPVTEPEDVRPLPASAWPPPEADQSDLLLKLAYLRGLLDAAQYAEVAPHIIGRVLARLEGKNLHQLAAEVDRYYLDDPGRRDVPPASVVLTVLPRQGGAPPPPFEESPEPRLQKPGADQ
jgi:hypothetical protein